MITDPQAIAHFFANMEVNYRLYRQSELSSDLMYDQTVYHMGSLFKVRLLVYLLIARG